MMSVKDILKDVSNSTRDVVLKTKIENAISNIEYQSNQYDNLGLSNQLHTISANQVIGGDLTVDEMKKIYCNKFSKGILREKYYDKLMALAATGKCPICGIGQVSNLDHYLAKSLYPIYAVTPVNLIPICKDCNFEKLDVEIQSYIQSPFHPYYDYLDNLIWLNAQVFRSSEGNIVVVYSVDGNIAKIDNNLYLRLKYHFDLYKLNKAYSIQATSEISENQKLWKKLLTNFGEDYLKQYLAECLDSKEDIQKNTWNTALLRALINDINILK